MSTQTAVPPRSIPQPNWGQAPIDNYKETILDAFNNNFVLQLIFPTSAGKSTRFPLWIAMLFDVTVIVAEPLIETAMLTSEHVAKSIGESIGKTIGHGTAESKKYAAGSRVIYATDGLIKAWLLFGLPKALQNRPIVLVIDELHQWNKNQTWVVGLLALIQSLGKQPFAKIVAMSATLDQTALQRSFPEVKTLQFEAQGYPVERMKGQNGLIKDVEELISKRYEVLLFFPGVSEISQFVTQAQRTQWGSQVALHAFHSKMPRWAKNKVYEYYNHVLRVIAGTNALETGVTIEPQPGAQGMALVDTGLVRRSGFEYNIETLRLITASLAERLQRLGRIGRTGPGIAYLYGPEDKQLEPYPVPEIERSNLAADILGFEAAGINPAQIIPFMPYKPSKAQLHDAYQTLFDLGLFRNGKVTTKGRLVAKLAIVSETGGLMIVNALKHGSATIDQVIKIVAVREYGSLKHQFPEYKTKWQSLVQPGDSDPLIELKLFNLAMALGDQARGSERTHKIEQMGIDAGVFEKAYGLYQQLQERVYELEIYSGKGETRARWEIPQTNSYTYEHVFQAVLSGLIHQTYKRVVDEEATKTAREEARKHDEKRGRAKASYDDIVVYSYIHTNGRHGPIKLQLDQNSVVSNETPLVAADPYGSGIIDKQGNPKMFWNLNFVIPVDEQGMAQALPEHRHQIKKSWWYISFKFGCIPWLTQDEVTIVQGVESSRKSKPVNLKKFISKFW